MLLAAWCCDQWNSLCSATALLLFLDQEQQLQEAGERRKQREGGFFHYQVTSMVVSNAWCRKWGEVMADLGCRERFGCLMNRAWGNVDDGCDRFKRVYTFDGCFRVAERCNEAQKRVWQQRQRKSLIPEVLFDPECTTQCSTCAQGLKGGLGHFFAT